MSFVAVAEVVDELFLRDFLVTVDVHVLEELFELFVLIEVASGRGKAYSLS